MAQTTQGADTPRPNPRALKRLHSIQQEACRLVVDRGYDGFTMDELAEAVGVSRRTLFNYVPDKASAVLGLFDADGHAAHALGTFRDGGPTGNLTVDLHQAIIRVTEDAEDFDEMKAEHHQLVEAAIAADPKVLAITTQRFERVTTLLEQAVTEREGWPAGDLRSRTLAATTLALIKVTLEEISRARTPSNADFVTSYQAVIAAHAATASSS